MSYSCYISFRQMEPENVLSFFKELKQFTTSQLQVIAQDEYPYCPYIRNDPCRTTSPSMSWREWRALDEEKRKELFPRDFENVSSTDRKEAERWARDVFQFRYAYDTERRLLCVFGVPTAVRPMFDGTVYFQNSCDQNYSEREWRGIKPLEDIYRSWMSKTEAEVLQWYVQRYGNTMYDDLDSKGGSDEDIAKEFAAKMEYARKSAAYDEIWQNYESMLYNDEDNVYLSLYNQMEITPITKFLKACHEAEIESRDENDTHYFEMLCGKNPDMQHTIEHMTGRPMDRPALMDEFMQSHPGYLDKHPELCAMYDELMNTPAEPPTEDIAK